MKRLLFIGLLAFCLMHADYKRLTDYQNILYGLIEHYVETNATSSAGAVLDFIYSDDTKTVFQDAKASGYTRKDLVFGTYQSSFGVTKPNTIIIKALHDAVERENVSYDAAFYGSYITMGSTGIIMIGMARYLWTYFKWDRPAINYYRDNHHKYTMTNTATNTATSTTPLLEPIIPTGGSTTVDFWKQQ